MSSWQKDENVNKVIKKKKTITSYIQFLSLLNVVQMNSFNLLLSDRASCQTVEFLQHRCEDGTDESRTLSTWGPSACLFKSVFGFHKTQ